MGAPAAHRLILRAWKDSDLAPFARINADPQVTRWLSGPRTRAESDAVVGRIRRHFDEHGFGLWAVEVPGRVAFAGYVGLAVPSFETTFTPCVEVGWRLGHDHWGQGYATEAARACVAFGFGELGLDEIVSFTAVGNRRSRAVMGRIGMREDHEFDHPALELGHELRRHVLYRLAPGDLSHVHQ